MRFSHRLVLMWVVSAAVTLSVNADNSDEENSHRESQPSNPQKKEVISPGDEFNVGPHKATPATTYEGMWVQSVAIDRMVGNPAWGTKLPSATRPGTMEIALDKSLNEETIEKAAESNQLWKHRFVATGQVRFGRSGDTEEESVESILCLLSHKQGNAYLWHEFPLGGMIASRLSYVRGATEDRDLLFVEWNPFFPRQHGGTAFLRGKLNKKDGRPEQGREQEKRSAPDSTGGASTDPPSEGLQSSSRAGLSPPIRDDPLEKLLNWQPPEASWDIQKSLWLRTLMLDVKSIEVGSTRADLEARFPSDGPNRMANATRYQHPRCPFVKIDVFFDVPDHETRHLPEHKVIRVAGPLLDLVSNYERW